MLIELYRAKLSWSIMREIVKRGDMQLVRHGSAIVAIIERRWERDYLSSVRGNLEWVPVYPVGGTVPLAEVHTATRQVRLCEGQSLFGQQEAELHPSEAE